MANIGTLPDRMFLRDLLNGISIPLEVRCAVLDAAGATFMCADLPAPADGLPFDVSEPFTKARLITSTTKRRWRDAFRDALRRAGKEAHPQSVEFRSHGIRLFQCIAPIMAGPRQCIGFVASGKVPVECGRSLQRAASVLEKQSRTGEEKDLAAALRSMGMLPESRIQKRMSMVAEAARAASRIAAGSFEASEDARMLVSRARMQIEALDKVVQAINEKRHTESILRIIVERGFRLVGADRGMIDIWDPVRGKLVITVAMPRDRRARLKEGYSYPPDKGISGWAFRNKRPALVSDLEKEKKWRDMYLEVFKGTRSELVVPLVYGDDAIGVIDVESESPNAFGKEHLKVLSTLAKHAVVAIVRARLIETQSRRLEAFAEATSALAAPYKLDEALEVLLQQVSVALGGSVASVKLYDDRDGSLRYRRICFADGRDAPTWDYASEVWVDEGSGRDTVSARVFRRRKPCLVRDVDEERLWQRPPWAVRSGIVVPLLTRRRPVGVLGVDSAAPNSFTRSDMRILQKLATGVAVAVENAWHDELVRRLDEVLSQSMAESVAVAPVTHRAGVLSMLARIVWEVMKPKACSVIVRTQGQGDDGWMSISRGCEFGIQRARPLRLRFGEGLCGASIRSGKIRKSRDVRSDPRFADRKLAREQGLISALSVPIRTDGRVIGALNYYSGMERAFSEFEEHSLKTICGIAGMIISATETERTRILHHIGTGITLIGVPGDWEERNRRRLDGDPDWNVELDMPLLFINETHRRKYAPKARIHLPCYQTFNSKEQTRPCAWCPTVRAIATGEPTTAITHSPAPPKGRIEHFRVTASVCAERDVVIESTTAITRELEARHLSARLIEAEDEEEVFGRGAECLGRGTRADCVAFAALDADGSAPVIERVYTLDRRVLREEIAGITEMGPEMPPEPATAQEYFQERETQKRWLFSKRVRHRACRKTVPTNLAKAISSAVTSEDGVMVAKGEDADAMCRESSLLSGARKAVLLRLGSRHNPIGCVILLDKAPGEIVLEEPGDEKYWCMEVAGELATRIDGLRLARRREELSRFRQVVLEQAPVGVVITDNKGRITEANRAWRAMAGGDITGRNLFKLGSTRSAGLTRFFRKALRGHEVQLPQTPFVTTFGKKLVLSANCVPLYDAQQRVSGLLITCWDLTEVRRQHDLLVNQREAVVLGGLAAGAVHEVRNPLKAAQYEAHYISRQLPRLLAAERRLQKCRLSAGELARLRRLVDEILSELSPAGRAPSWSTPEAIKSIRKMLTRRKLPHERADVVQLARVATARRIEQVLTLQDGRYARRILSYLTTLAAVVYASNNISHSMARIAELADALESQSFISVEKRQYADLRGTINGALVILRGRLDDLGITRVREYSPRLPKIWCVPGQLSQLWRNLLENSIQAIKDVERRGRIVITTRKRGPDAVVTIEDDGAGVTQKVDIDSLGRRLPRIEEGTVGGYGLWIVRRVVMNHGGSFQIRPSPGRGTVVTVVLPIKRNRRKQVQSPKT